MATSLTLSAERIAPTTIVPRAQPRAVASPSSAIKPITSSSDLQQQSQPTTVIVDVTDAHGVHRSITVSPSDSTIDLAQRYAMSVPGGISEKQFQKLVNILNDTVLQHFGRVA